MIAQPHLPNDDPYVASGYVASGYFQDAVPVTPYIFIDKTTTPPTLYIYDIETSGSRVSVDCVFDAVAIGLRSLSSDSLGNIKETV